MRVRRLRINNWRNFHNIEVSFSEKSSLICLVGANGTGKTSIFELISACAHQIGLSHGTDIPRGNPFSDETKDFEVEFYLAKGFSSAIDNPVGNPNLYSKWDRTILVNGPSRTILAGGITNYNESNHLATEIAHALRNSKEVYYLTLDADRAFPRKELQARDVAQAFQTQWDDADWSKGRAFHRTSTLYEEWSKYCMAKENKAANLFYQNGRQAAETGGEPPKFVDVFGNYRTSLKQVMPHLHFFGVDQEQKSILFDTAGTKLRFDQLSGGEREVAFLIGQIDRFSLRNGIFLLDEPELHLNPDLVRTWVTYLRNTVSAGQIWLATHSLEAVEAAGLKDTIILERDNETKKVNWAGSLSEQPVLSALSRAVGTPAFSLTKLRFILIEGEETIGERERYRRVTSLSADTRFIECGSCGEVVRRLNAIQDIAKEANQPIRISGIIDRDWRTDVEISKLLEIKGVISLNVHEIENFFLHEDTLKGLALQLGRSDFQYKDVLQQACDDRAGGWIIQSALSNESCSDISNLPSEARATAFAMKWQHIEGNIVDATEKIGNLSGFDEKRIKRLNKVLEVYAKKI